MDKLETKTTLIQQGLFIHSLRTIIELKIISIFGIIFTNLNSIFPRYIWFY